MTKNSLVDIFTLGILICSRNMAKLTKTACQHNQARKQRSLKPMPLTRKIEQLTQTANWVSQYERFIKKRLSTDYGKTSLLHRGTFCTTLDLLSIFRVNQDVLLFKLHRMVNMPNNQRIEGTTFHTYASLAPMLNEILLLELTKLGPLKMLLKKINWNKVRETIQ